MNDCNDGTCPDHDPDFPLYAVQEPHENLQQTYIHRGGPGSLFPGLNDGHFIMVITKNKDKHQAFEEYIQLRKLPFHFKWKCYWDPNRFSGTGYDYLKYLTTINKERNRPLEFAYNDENKVPRHNCSRGCPIDGLKNILYPTKVIDKSIMNFIDYWKGDINDIKESFLKCPSISKRTKAYIMGWEVPKSLDKRLSESEKELEGDKMENDISSELVNVMTQKKGIITKPETSSHQQNTEFASESEQKSLDTSEETNENQETLSEDEDKLAIELAGLSVSDGNSIVNNDLITPPATQTSLRETEVGSDVAQE